MRGRRASGGRRRPARLRLAGSTCSSRRDPYPEDTGASRGDGRHSCLNPEFCCLNLESLMESGLRSPGLSRRVAPALLSCLVLLLVLQPELLEPAQRLGGG